MRIELTQGKVALVDDADGVELQKHKWCAMHVYNCWYAVRRPTHNGPLELMHRTILDPPSGLEVDHINLDGLDNRRENLRVASRQQNSRNTRPRTNAVSRFKGVSRNLRGGRPWRGRIVVDRREIGLGYFTTEAEAALAYNEAATRLFGEYALLNEV